MDGNSVIIANEAIVSNLVDFAIPLVAALVGGAIAGGFTLCGVMLAHSKDLDKQTQNQRKVLESFYQAIQTEIETAWQAYMSEGIGSKFGGIGWELEKLPEGQPFEISYPFTMEAFPVYKANLHLIGQITDSELRTLIIRTYAQGQGVIDSTVYNNSLISEHTKWDWMYYGMKNQLYKDRLDAETKCMVDYAKTMKAQHHEIKKSIEALLKKLNTILPREN